MHIVLEGPDNAGKSTLAKELAAWTHRQVIPSEGREKSPGEINTRIRRYFDDYENVIFDRHPCVSQPIYFHVVPNTPVEYELERQFYKDKPILIYCKGDALRGMAGHEAKDYDDPAYLKEIESKYLKLMMAYNNWAIQHAHFIYRIGDSMPNIIKAVKGVLA